MFRRGSKIDKPTVPITNEANEKITSVLGPGVMWEGRIRGSGNVRIEGTFEGQISLQGILVVGETGSVTCENVRANAVIVAGAVRGNITTQKLEIRSSGRVWGNVVTTAFVTEEEAFLRGQIRMEESVDLNLDLTTETEEPENNLDDANLVEIGSRNDLEQASIDKLAGDSTTDAPPPKKKKKRKGK